MSKLTVKTFVIVLFTIALWHNKQLKAQKTEKFAVIVGCADYQREGMDLRYSDDDAYRYYAYLQSCKGGGAVDNENIACLIDEAATKNNILQTMNTIFSKAGPEDMLIFYFSGHGAEGAFVPIDASQNYNSLITFDEIKAIFKKYNAKYKMVFADACFSGTLYEGNPAANSQSNNTQTTNVVIIMSSKSTETSQENPHIRQGTFSYYFLKGLRGAADRNKDEIITLEELFPYIKANVLNFTNNKQTPTIEGNASPNTPIGTLK